jgi:hypothetical protein
MPDDQKEKKILERKSLRAGETAVLGSKRRRERSLRGGVPDVSDRAGVKLRISSSSENKCRL